MILCKDPIVTFDQWELIYSDVRKRKDLAKFGYGIRVNVDDYPELLSAAQTLPFRDHFFFLISHKRNREFPIHVDGVPGEHNAASVNWPLLNCDSHSPTIWYECESREYQDLDNSFFLDNVEDAIEIHRDTMYSHYRLPYLFRGELLHKGYCNLNTNEMRIIVKWELDYDTWEDACSGFRDRNYI